MITTVYLVLCVLEEDEGYSATWVHQRGTTSMGEAYGWQREITAHNPRVRASVIAVEVEAA